MSGERRQHPRVEVLAQVQVTRDAEVHVMSTSDISRGGIFIQGDPADAPDLLPGVDCDLVLFDADADREEVMVRATVVHIVDRPDAKGFGLRFKTFMPGHAARLKTVLTELDPEA